MPLLIDALGEEFEERRVFEEPEGECRAWLAQQISSLLLAEEGKFEDGDAMVHPDQIFTCPQITRLAPHFSQ